MHIKVQWTKNMKISLSLDYNNIYIRMRYARTKLVIIRTVSGCIASTTFSPNIFLLQTDDVRHLLILYSFINFSLFKFSTPHFYTRNEGGTVQMSVTYLQF